MTYIIKSIAKLKNKLIADHDLVPGTMDGFFKGFGTINHTMVLSRLAESGFSYNLV